MKTVTLDDITKTRIEYSEGDLKIEQYGNIREPRVAISKDEMLDFCAFVNMQFGPVTTTWLGWFRYA